MGEMQRTKRKESRVAVQFFLLPFAFRPSLPHFIVTHRNTAPLWILAVWQESLAVSGTAVPRVDR